MKRHWKRFAERAGNPSFSAKAVSEEVPYVLRRELPEVPLSKLRDVLTGRKQNSLFVGEQIKDLEAIRPGIRGQAFANTALDCMIDAVSRGLRGDAALADGMISACDSHLRAESKSVEEHYRRKQGAKTGLAIRDRLDGARRQADINKVVSDYLAPKRPRVSRPSKHTGLDEGPAL